MALARLGGERGGMFGSFFNGLCLVVVFGSFGIPTTLAHALETFFEDLTQNSLLRPPALALAFNALSFHWSSYQGSPAVAFDRRADGVT